VKVVNNKWLALLCFLPSCRVPFALRTVDTEPVRFFSLFGPNECKVTASGKIFVGATLRLRGGMGGVQRVAGGVNRWLRDALRTLSSEPHARLQTSVDGW
jgi:hypothetical protein